MYDVRKIILDDKKDKKEGQLTLVFHIKKKEFKFIIKWEFYEY